MSHPVMDWWHLAKAVGALFGAAVVLVAGMALVALGDLAEARWPWIGRVMNLRVVGWLAGAMTVAVAFGIAWEATR